jgi:hypothetical protein
VERVDSVDGETLEQMEADAGEAKVRRNAWSVGAEAAAVERLRLRLEGGVRRDRLWGTHTIERLIEALAAATEGLGLAAQRLAVYEAEEKARVQQEEPSQEGGGGRSRQAHVSLLRLQRRAVTRVLVRRPRSQHG